MIEPFGLASSKRSGMNRRSLLSGSRKRNVRLSSVARSEPKAFPDMRRTRTYERSRPSSILAGMLLPARISQASSQTRKPSDFSFCASW